MRSPNRLTASALLACACAALTLVPVDARADCAPDTLSWIDDDTNTLVTRVTSSGSDAYYGGVFTVLGFIVRKQQEASYDLRTGALHAKADMQVTYMAGGALAHGRVRAHDTYNVLGPDGAAPATITARLDYHATCAGYYEYSGPYGNLSMPSGDARIVFTEGVAQADSTYHTGNGTYHDSLEVVVTRAPGGTFELSFDVHAIANGVGDYSLDYGSNRTTTIDADLVFRDLPAGWSIVSCQGYQAGQIVPARKSTWGRVKSARR